MIGRWTVLNGVLVLIVALLGIQITRTWMRAVPPLRAPAAASGEAGPRRDAKAKPAPGRAERAGDQAAEQVALITSFDLFDPSRQPVGADGDVAAAAEVPPPTGIELVGVRLIGDDPEAFIRDASQQNAQRRVRMGDEVAGYTVQTITATNVELNNPTGQTVTLWLQLAPSAGKPGGAGAVARPTAAGAQSPRPGVTATPGTPAPLDPTAAQRQRERQRALRQQRRGAGGSPSVPSGVQQRLDQMRRKGA